MVINATETWQSKLHIGTNWTAQADQNDVELIFWLSVTHILFAFISISYARCRTMSYEEVDHEEMQGRKRVVARK